MISVERAVEYTTLEQEPNEGEEANNWPSEGAIIFKNVTLCYDGCKTPVLKRINFEVKPGEKIGIVGRTGAGKSSILTVLFRLYNFDGAVYIDGRNIKSLSLEFMR